MNEPQRWAQAYAATADPAHHCLAPEDLLAAWDDSAPAVQRERALAALAKCAQCAAVAQIARDLQAHMAADAQAFAALDSSAVVHSLPEAARARVPRRVTPLQRWAAAAVVVLGLGTATLVLREPAAPPVVRGEATAALEPASGSRLHAPPPRLRWNAIGTASAYQVELYDEAAQSLWRSERVAGTTVELPEALRTQMRRGTFLWRVRAEGSEVEIGPFYFRVEP